MAKERASLGGLSMGADLVQNAQKNADKIIAAKNEPAHNTHDTQGAQRKQKHPRINMAFYGDNLDYVRDAAYQCRLSVTEYVNKLIEEDKRRNG